jgi:ABC-type phosphate/phosphonate transport system substrate-binding protein
MFGQRGNTLRLVVLTVAIFASSWCAAGGGEGTSAADPVRIGMVGTLFRDVPENVLLAMMSPFSTLMESQTGVTGQLVAAGDAANLGRQLAEDKVQLAVFHGIEFGWARQKYPDLRPLMIAVNQDRHLRAQLVVRSEAPVGCIADLKNKGVAVPRGTREHCYVFISQQCQNCGTEAKTYFSRITTPPNVEEALDDVVDRIVEATIVDNVALDCYKRLKPGRYAKLKLAQQSEIFPAAVIAYRPGTLDEATLQRFRQGLVNANKTLLGRQMLTLWKLTGFEAVPTDYEQTLTDILKSYPQPTEAQK